jgi:hypothetical protein
MSVDKMFLGQMVFDLKTRTLDSNKYPRDKVYSAGLFYLPMKEPSNYPE